MKISALTLQRQYWKQNKSVAEIAQSLGCSQHKVNYWMDRYGIPKRSQSDALYVKHNPKGDPFNIKKMLTKNESFLYGLGVGLFWGEGHKKSKNGVRLANTDPALIRRFVDFLADICGVKREEIGYSLLIFSDISPTVAKNFWIKQLQIKPKQIRGKITVIKSGRIGNYRQKSKYGVLIVQYYNRNLRNAILEMIDEQRA